jgi:hypothetical protein
MAEEIKHNFVTGKTLYACRFILSNSNVLLANPATNEVWGTGGRDADDYDVQMTEEGGSGHYTCDFADGGSISAGVYHVVVYNQAGANPVDGDVALAQGEIYWNGTAEETLQTIFDKLPDNYIMGSSDTEDHDDEIDAIVANLGNTHTVEDESPGGGGRAPATTSGIAEGC